MSREEKLEVLKKAGIINCTDLFDTLTEEQLTELIVNTSAIFDAFGEESNKLIVDNASSIMKVRNEELQVLCKRKDQEYKALKESINSVLYPLQKLLK